MIDLQSEHENVAVQTHSPDDESRILKCLRETPEVFQQLQNQTGSELHVQRVLRSRFDTELVTAALAVFEARQKAADRLPAAQQLWLTRVGLEQSTAWEVAQHKATRFPEREHVVDLCGGIGVDTAALLSRASVTTVDINPAMSIRCSWNTEAWRASGAIAPGYDVECITGDAVAFDPGASLLHADPDRRSHSNRAVKRLEQYCPDLTWMHNTVQSAKGGAIKLGPASNFVQKFPGCEIELISLNGECREATVWFGCLAGKSPYRATVLPTGESITADPLSAWCPVATAAEDFLFDPDPAVVRSGLLDVVAEKHSLQRMDREDEYLTGAVVPETSFVTPYRIDAVLPNNMREVRRYLRTHPGRDYEIKCRHLRVNATALQKKLPRGDGPIRVIFFLRLSGRANVVIAERMKNPLN